MARPKKGTPEFDLWVLAVDTAIAPPLKQGSAARAGVPWSVIHELREVLDKLGVDWRSAKIEDDKLRAEHKRREQEERRARYGEGAE